MYDLADKACCSKVTHVTLTHINWPKQITCTGLPSMVQRSLILLKGGVVNISDQWKSLVQAGFPKEQSAPPGGRRSKKTWA